MLQFCTLLNGAAFCAAMARQEWAGMVNLIGLLLGLGIALAVERMEDGP